MSQPTIYEENDRYIIRLRKMSDTASKKYFLKLLRWTTPKWDTNAKSFQEYLKTTKRFTMETKKGYTMTKFKRDLKPSQKGVMETDRSCETYDISLLFMLIQWGNEDLADKDDRAWTKEIDCLEYLITAVKNHRNSISHNYDPIDEKVFRDKVEKLRDLLKKTISEAKGRLPHIPQHEINESIREVDNLIDHIRDDPLDPRDNEACKQCVKSKGVKSLQGRYRNYSSLNPASSLLQRNIPLNNVFTGLSLEEDTIGNSRKLELKDLLDVCKSNPKNPVLTLCGKAGSGKTTVVKKLLLDWTEQKGYIKDLNSYDLLIYFEFRDHVESMSKLLSSCMREVSQTLSEYEMLAAIRDMPTLIIADGYDEANQQTTRLFQEILPLQVNANFTILVTSRPEALPRLRNLLSSCNTPVKYINLLGIPQERCEEFVTKYYNGLKDLNSNISLDFLLQYIRRTQLRMGDVWELPYNLCIVTILWMLKPNSVNIITTSTELHWQMHILTKEKLKKRLVDQKRLSQLSDSFIDRKLETFIYCLCQVSVQAVAKNEVDLDQMASQQLKNICDEQFPFEEMAGAFLKIVNTSSGQRYSYAHKGVLDFLVGHYIWMRLTAPHLQIDIQVARAKVDDALSSLNLPIPIAQDIRDCVESKLISHRVQMSSTSQSFDCDETQKKIEELLVRSNAPEDLQKMVKKIFSPYRSPNSNAGGPSAIPQNKATTIIGSLKKTVSKIFSPDNSSDINLRPSGSPQEKNTTIIRALMEEADPTFSQDLIKYNNAFKCLIGMFYLDPKKISTETKLEALKILEKTGVKGKEDWLSLLNNVKCDPFVAEYISKISQILDGEIKVTDANVLAYTSLLQALQPPIANANQIEMEVNVKENVSEFNDFLSVVSKHKLQVSLLYVNEETIQCLEMLLTSLKLKDLAISKVTKDFEIKNVWKIIQHKVNISQILFEYDFKKKKTAMTPSEANTIHDILQQCHVEIYVGQITSNMRWDAFSLVKHLRVAIRDESSFVVFKEWLCHSPQDSLIWLSVSIDVSIPIDVLVPLPGIEFLGVFFPDLEDDKVIDRVLQFMQRLLPTQGRYNFFYHVFFPRCNLSPEGIERLCRGMEEGRWIINGVVVFPTICSIPYKQLGLSYRIERGRHPGWTGTIYDMDKW